MSMKIKTTGSPRLSSICTWVGALLLSASIVSVPACAKQSAGADVERQAPSLSNAQVVEPAAFARLHEQRGGILLDVRTPSEVAQKTIGGASTVNLRDSGFRAKVARMDKTAPVFVYCAAGGRSKQAARILLEQGFSEVYDLQGGITAWTQAGLPVERGLGAAPANKEHAMSPAQFDALLSEHNAVLANFKTTWCEPCRRMAPVVKQVAAGWANQLRLATIDVDSSEALAERETVAGLPVLVLYREGKEAWRYSGLMSAAELHRAIAKGLP